MYYTLRWILTIIAILGSIFVGMFTTKAEAGTFSNTTIGYMDSVDLSDSIEAHGITVRGRHYAVDTASCYGLRRYGVRKGSWGLDKFHRFSCDVFDSNDGMWDLRVVAVTNSRWIIYAVHDYMAP